MAGTDLLTVIVRSFRRRTRHAVVVLVLRRRSTCLTPFAVAYRARLATTSPDGVHSPTAR